MRAYGDDRIIKAVLEDYEAAPIDDRLRETLRFLRKLTLSPDEVSAADVAPMRALGLSDEAIEEAIRVCFCFNLVDRLADAFDFELSAGKQARLVTFVLYHLGYGQAAIPG